MKKALDVIILVTCNINKTGEKADKEMRHLQLLTITEMKDDFHEVL